MASFTHFTAKYNDWKQYPYNHISASTYGEAALRQHRDRLWECRESLFVPGRDSTLPVRDISASGNVSKINIFSNHELGNFLREGDTQTATNGSQGIGDILHKKDEKCRFIFLCTETAVGPLELSAPMLLRLMSFYQVMPHYLDFLFVYASSHGRDKELHFSGFRTEKALMNPSLGTDIPELGRSGRKYQLCYNLKTAASKEDGSWKIRQAAIHHQFDVGQGVQLWMVGDPHAAIKDRISELYPEHNIYPTSFSTMGQSFKSSLEIHLVYARWATSEWRWNVKFLEDVAQDLTLTAALVKEKSHIESLDPGSLGGVQRWEEKTNDTIMAMESNISIMTLLQRFYRGLVRDDDFPAKERQFCLRAVKDFSFQLDELICETQMQISRAKILVKIVADRKAILIQHLQTQSALVSSKLTASMYDQADRSAMEAIAVRIVTIVTLIYLPATFSSTFFSTDVVKYQGGETFSWLALERFLEVTLPLMFFTFALAGLWFWFESRRRSRKSHETKNYFGDFFLPKSESYSQ